MVCILIIPGWEVWANFGNPSYKIPNGANRNSIDFYILRNLLEEYIFHLPKNPLFEDPI